MADPQKSTVINIKYDICFDSRVSNDDFDKKTGLSSGKL
jgi:hypothetical protein